METIIREVNPARLAWGIFDHAKSDYVNEGDIPASYSGDCIAMGQPVRKPFRMDGEMWLAIGLSNDGARVSLVPHARLQRNAHHLPRQERHV